jgi:CheY-like chemotaxis protein
MQKVLYVDDDRMRMRVTMEFLELAGYAVIPTHTGADALQRLKEEAIDLAVVDYYMPGMTGDVVAAEMKHLKPDVPVVIWSGTFSMPVLVAGLADGFVCSGSGPQGLITKISELLAARAARQ